MIEKPLKIEHNVLSLFENINSNTRQDILSVFSISTDDLINELVSETVSIDYQHKYIVSNSKLYWVDDIDLIKVLGSFWWITPNELFSQKIVENIDNMDPSEIINNIIKLESMESKIAAISFVGALNYDWKFSKYLNCLISQLLKTVNLSESILIKHEYFVSWFMRENDVELLEKVRNLAETLPKVNTKWKLLKFISQINFYWEYSRVIGNLVKSINFDNFNYRNKAARYYNYFIWAIYFNLLNEIITSEEGINKDKLLYMMILVLFSTLARMYIVWSIRKDSETLKKYTS